jgi:hypothetical protein
MTKESITVDQVLERIAKVFRDEVGTDLAFGQLGFTVTVRDGLLIRLTCSREVSYKLGIRSDRDHV